MAKAIMMEEFHLSVFAPRQLPSSEYDGIHQTITNANFRAKLRRAVRAVFRQYPSLTKVKITITR